MKFKSFLHNEGYAIYGYDKEDARDMMKRSPNFPNPDKEGDRPIKSIDFD